jgi:hypothetical protein
MSMFWFRYILEVDLEHLVLVLRNDRSYQLPVGVLVLLQEQDKQL